MLAVNDTFTQEDIEDGLIKFVHTGNTADVETMTFLSPMKMGIRVAK